MSRSAVDVYIDYKSPYSYLAVEPAWRIEEDYDVELRWLHYTLDIPSFLGSGRVDEEGKVVESDRTERQWRGIRYAYADVRRYANLRGLTVRGPRKIWDSSLAAIGMLWAQRQQHFRQYNDLVYERFWKRELDVEDPEVLASVLAEVGAETAGFLDFLAGEGRREHDEIRARAEERGVWGVPTFVVDDEVFFGREHVSMVRLRLHERGLARNDAVVPDVSHAWRPTEFEETVL